MSGEVPPLRDHPTRGPRHHRRSLWWLQGIFRPRNYIGRHRLVWTVIVGVNGGPSRRGYGRIAHGWDCKPCMQRLMRKAMGD